jgi:hypothetical protein
MSMASGKMKTWADLEEDLRNTNALGGEVELVPLGGVVADFLPTPS